MWTGQGYEGNRWPQRTELQEENSIKSYTQLGWKELLAASTCFAVLLPKLCRALCRHPKLRQLRRLGRWLSAVSLVQLAMKAGRKTDCMQDKALWPQWFRQTGSVVINKMCLWRQINDRTDCCPPKLQEQGLEEQDLTLLVGLLKYWDEHLEEKHRVGLFYTVLCSSSSLVTELKMFAFHVVICKTDLSPIWLFSYWRCCTDHSPVILGHHLSSAALQMCKGEKAADSQCSEGTRRRTKLGNAPKIHSTISPRLLVLSKLTGSFQLCFWTRLLPFLTIQ